MKSIQVFRKRHKSEDGCKGLDRGRERAANTRHLRELSEVMEMPCIMIVIMYPFVKTHQTVLLNEVNLLLNEV